jgi:uncharacterized protein YxjI
MPTAFDVDTYHCRRKIIALVGKISVTDASGAVVAYSRQKAFKLREEIRVFTDESEGTPLLMIKARNIIDFGATYDVTAPDGNVVGALRRKGFKSMVKDQWIVLGSGDSVDGSLDEVGTGMALARRFIPFVAWFVSQDYTMTANSTTIARMQRNRNPFVSKLEVQVERGAAAAQRRLLLAAAVLLLIIEGKEED